eukprot:TRINITY_DN55_c0_g1_i1.p1 TRINITY_DN55_c0_g1~~TRINITY_DN55_c0_g1_i1.p1  ORF type:complete len:400 (-),score=94.40 TRINITY_DN55_c0_g1_i1:71-1270(-)
MVRVASLVLWVLCVAALAAASLLILAVQLPMSVPDQYDAPIGAAPPAWSEAEPHGCPDCPDCPAAPAPVQCPVCFPPAPAPAPAPAQCRECPACACEAGAIKAVKKAPAAALAPAPAFAGTTEATVPSFVAPRRVFPQLQPQVCVAALSCRRLPMLETTLSSIIAHMEKDEDGLSYEISWLDQKGTADGVQNITSKFQIERVMMQAENYGIGFALNTLIFDMCRWSQYVISVEEDWRWRDECNFAVIRRAIEVLKEEKLANIVVLKPVVFAGIKVSEWRSTLHGVEYRLLCPGDGVNFWGAWVNGAVVIDRGRLLSTVGRQAEEVYHDYGAEANYAMRAFQAGRCGAELRLFPDCNSLQCNHAFTHIGVDAQGKRLPSVCYKDNSKEMFGGRFYRGDIG